MLLSLRALAVRGTSLRRAACLVACAAGGVAGCASEERASAAAPTAPVEVPSAAASDAPRRWSDARAWPDGRVPQAGDDVTIPAGVTMIVDTSTASLRRVDVAGTLVAADGRDVELTARAVVVRGVLAAGDASRRHVGRFVVTLDAVESDVGTLGVATNGIVVEPGGRLELHGADVPIVWTRLATNVAPGGTTLMLERAPGWHVGDRIVLTSTDFDPTHAEEAVVTEIQGARIALDRPLRHLHWGRLQRIAGVDIDERAEVASLTRSVVIRGAPASETSGFGGHVMILAGGTAHLDGVELHRMGQRGRVARYPIHWHLARETEGQYARNSSVWHSYNRCLTIHGTHGVRVENNVCFDHQGHGYFLEDGVEHGNVLAGNLGVRTRIPAAADRVLESDERAATFWVTNPDNELRDNVAAGSDGFGFWYALPEHPTGLSTTSAVWPRRTPLRAFVGNRAHSNARSGLWVDDGPLPDGSTQVTNYTPSVNALGVTPDDAVFRDFTAFKNQHHGAWLRGGDLHLVGATFVDNMVGATFAGWESTLESSTVVGETENVATNPGAWAEPRGFWFYDGRVGVRATTFARFGGATTAAIGFHPVNPWPLNAQNWLDAVRFVDAQPLRFELVEPRFDGTKSAAIVDRDGSLTGVPNATVVAPTPFLARAACAYRADWRAQLCAARVAQLTLRATTRLAGAVAVRRLDVAGAATSVAPIAFDPTFTTLTVPIGAPLAVDFTGEAPAGLDVDGSGFWGGDVADVSVPMRGDPRLIVVRGETGTPFRRVDASAMGSCDACWSSTEGRVRLRLPADGATGRVFATITAS